MLQIILVHSFTNNSALLYSLFQCWENFVGQQFYCLVVIDFIFIILGTLCSEFLYKKYVIL